MNLIDLIAKKRELVNPKTLKRVMPGPKASFFGARHRIKYSASYLDEIKVDEEDFEHLLSLRKHGRNYFILVEPEEKMVNAEIDLLANDIEGSENTFSDFELEVEEPAIEPDNFQLIDGIGQSLSAKILNEGITSFDVLYLKGEKWIADLPRVSEDKAKQIYKQLEKLVGE